MSGPLRFDQLEPARQDVIRKNLDTMHAKGAPDADVESYLRDVEHLAPVGQEAPQEGLVSRVGHQVISGVSDLVRHPIDTAKGILEAPVRSAITAMSPGVGEARHSAALSKGGNSSGRPIDTSPYDAEHGGVTGKERLAGAAQTMANIAAPGIAGGVAGKLGGGMLAKAAGLSAAGGAEGAAYTPNDPLAGGLAGSILAPALGAAGERTGKVIGKAGSSAVDFMGRPMESRPAIQAGPVKIGNIEGIEEHAARRNAGGLERAKFFTDVQPDFAPNDKPVAAIDQHTSAQRMARGLKTSSPSAEQALRGTLEPRAASAVERVINQAKDLTGIKRASAFETTQQLHDRLNAESDENYGKVWAKEEGRGPVEHPDLASVLSRPAVKHAIPLAAEMQANEGIAKPATGRPPGIPDDQWAMVKSAMERQGIKPPSDGPSLTLQDLHNAKLAIDDMKRSGIERGPGAGGVGYNRGKSMGAAQKSLLNVMDAWSPEYGKARAVTADLHTLKRASEAGQEHWSRDPAESAAMLKDMTPGEQALYKSTAFDKWAERVENGPENVGKAQAKPMNQKRLRALFPDDASFEKFQQGLKTEAQMHATNQGVLGGSNSMDKMADMAGDAGVTLPEILSAAGGHFMPAVRGVASRALKAVSNENTEKISAARARLLAAGAGGDATARLAARQKMEKYRPQPGNVRPPAGGILGAINGTQQQP